MKTVFVDTNIVLDVLLKNEGFWQDSAKIFALTERKEIRAFISASSVTDIFYIIRKKLTVPVARSVIENIINLFEIVGVDGDDLKSAITIPIADMEDALQAWCAKKSGAETLITRNTDDFSSVDIHVVTPAMFSLD